VTIADAPLTGPGRLRSGRGWPVVLALLLLSAIPLAGGTLRLLELRGVDVAIESDPRFTAEPTPLVVHVLAAAVFAVLGAFQLLPHLRRGKARYHRRAGRVVLAAGLLTALSGLWMTLAYDAKPGTGRLLFVVRLLVSAGTALALATGFRAIRRRDVRSHRAWMMRAYALGLGAGTQAFTQGFGEPLMGSGVLAHDVQMSAGWAINLAVAEWAIRRAPRHKRRARAHPPTGSPVTL
jgi:uncharacterized membrane protein